MLIRINARTFTLLFLLFFLVGCLARTSEPPRVGGCDDGQTGAPCSVVNGFNGNHVPSDVIGATISGGGGTSFPNTVLLDYGVVGGGKGNLAGNLSAVGGGFSNDASGIRAFIGGGANNTASRDSAVIGGGYGNIADQSYTTISGGELNKTSGSWATIGGGSGNIGNGRYATVGGGTHNLAESAYASIGGGTYNEAGGGNSAIAGGTRNKALGIGSTIGGGSGNRAIGYQSAIGGGLANSATGDYSLVSGGRGNQAGIANSDPEVARYATVGGGYENIAAGAFSVVPGGLANYALGEYSLAAGNRARVEPDHPGTFVFADSSDYPFSSSSANEFAARATGGVRFVTAVDESGAPMAGVRLGAGSGAWESLSDRNAKSSIQHVDVRQVLEALVGLPISTWRYRGQDETVRHIGPMAQDFYAVFDLGQDERYISTVDADGVALASIQGLYQLLQEKDAQIIALQAENLSQGQQLADLDARITALERHSFKSGAQIYWYLAMGAALLLGVMLGRGERFYSKVRR